jgi:probable rRNA maturation factor
MELNNLTDFSIDTNLLRKIISIILKEEKRKGKEISIAIVEEEKMKELSKIYRNKDYATDVLSFFYNEEDFLGEIIVCPKEVERRKKEDFTKEICRVTIHGALHLLGYDHENDKDEEEMQKREDYYLKKALN